MTANKPAADFDQSLALTIDTLKGLRDKGVSQPELLTSFSGFLFDLDHFATNKRNQVLKKVNSALGTSFSMAQVNRAKKTGAAVHTDGLSGKVDGKALTEETTEAPKEEAKKEFVHSLDQTRAFVAVLHSRLPVIAERGNEGREELYQEYLEELDEGEQDVFSQIVTRLEESTLNEEEDLILSDFAIVEFTLSHPVARKGFNEFVDLVEAAQTNHNTQSETTRQELTLENDTMTTSNQDKSLAEQLLENSRGVGAATHQEPVLIKASPAFITLLDQAGIADMDKFKVVEGNFLRNNTDLTASFLAFSKNHSNMDSQAVFEEFLKKNPDLTAKFSAFIFIPANHAPAESAVQAQAEGLVATVQRSMRGNRDSGFSSGVVGAVAAVVGGGIEMVTRGGIGIGAGVGTAVGAVGAYFLAEAAEKVMDSDTGRYILSGSIGLVAGGLGSSLGRAVSSQGLVAIVPGGEDTLQRLPEAIRPAPAQTTTAADGFVPMFSA